MTAKEILALAQAHRSEPSLANYTALADAVKAMEADAERYRFLEHQCRTGTYRGIISRKAIDDAMSTLQGAQE